MPESEPHDDKFIVFKRAEFNEWAASPIGTRRLPPPVEDAVVLRRQDVFAPPALDAYASSILTAVEALDALAAQFDEPPSNIAERAKGLREIAEYFSDQARAAWDTERRLPD